MLLHRPARLMSLVYDGGVEGGGSGEAEHRLILRVLFRPALYAKCTCGELMLYKNTELKFVWCVWQ